MEIERDTALRGWWLEYNPEDEREKNIIDFKSHYDNKPERRFVSDSELKQLYPVIKKYGKPNLNHLEDKT